jgi:hypothetical protein
MYELLEKTAAKNETSYVIDIITYKKIKYENLHIDFIEKIKDYYHHSKRYYVDRVFSYNSFTNILRQICKLNNIPFSKNITYSNSKHYIEYFVDFEK